MHLVIFGLTISSSWGNGHATLWRGFLHALIKRGHTVTFYERDVPYYANARDGWTPPPGASLLLYGSFEDIREHARRELDCADLALFTSFCLDGAEAASLMLGSRAMLRAFYDLDTPVTLDSLRRGAPAAYLPAEGLRGFDLVLSFTGGRALAELRTRLEARAVAPIYGWVDPAAHFPVAPVEQFRGALCYLGTYAADRQRALEHLFLEPARRTPEDCFQLAGALYPDASVWPRNVAFVRHLEPRLHPAFLCSSRATLNITRGVMAEFGYCPSGRLFEAAACGTPILSDGWDGLETFFAPGREILRVDTADDVLAALSLTDAELRRVAEAARANVLARHTAERRVEELERLCEGALGPSLPAALAS